MKPAARSDLERSWKVQRSLERWVGHRLQGEATVLVGAVSLAEGDRIAAEAERQAMAHLRTIDNLHVRVTAGALH